MRKIRAAWIATMLCLTCSIGCGPGPMELVGQANNLLGAGDTDGAIRLYREALRSSPDLAIAHNNLGWALQNKGDLAAAREEYEAALRLKPDLAEAHNNMGLLADASGELEEALVHYRRAVELNPQYGQAHNNMASVLYLQGHYPEAIRAFQQALRLDGESVNLLTNLGLAHQRAGELKAAEQAFARVVQLNPFSAPGYANLAYLMILEERWDEALAHYEHALTIDGRASYALAGRGIALALQGKVEEAREALDAAEKINPRSPLLHLARARLAWEAGDREETLRFCRAGLEIDSDNLELKALLERLRDTGAAG